MGEIVKNKQYLTLEEAVRAIADEFKPEQLKKLEITYKDGSPISFEKQLLNYYENCYCKYWSKKALQEAVCLVCAGNNQGLKTIDFFNIFTTDNPSKHLDKEKQWKEQKKTNNICLTIGGLTLLTSIIVPIILKFV